MARNGRSSWHTGKSGATRMVALYALWYNFVRIHKTLGTSPAMAARIESRLWSMEDVVALIDARSAKVGGETIVG
jgi:hypothetical protein